MRRRGGVWGAMAAAGWLAFLAAAALAAPVLFFRRAVAMDFTHILEPPSAAHFFGTDALGRDLLSRLLSGASVSLGAGIAAVAVAALVGVLVGAFAGYYGGWRDRVLMGVVDVMLCFPVFFLILAVISILGSSLWNIMLVIGLTGWMGTARLVRAEVLSLKEREFILAARAIGASPFRVIFKHLVPNALAPVLANAVLGVSTAILIETGLSFLGIGVQPPTPSWGNVLADGKASLGVAWWPVLFPGFMILLTALSVNALGERLDEKARGEREGVFG